ncbi:hypothetical protein RBH29_05350 [Herbivorax sp. ANBcel31]|uniref:hypothetical protein n=1 Tax=Herbivorax sp. ANBcel31 TaxID=3069754 RepID=UPI0027B4ED95|nr:hypothetical protein [Herbivorax sp. ANBcel31]MDQ2085862.1 hypothetical protein [Herbivorax sp. ANBcel31]
MKYKIIIIAAMFFIFYGCSASVIEVGPKREVNSYSEKLFEVNENDEISISCDSGNIEFFNWDRKEVKLEIKKRVTGIWQNNNLDEKLHDFKVELIEEDNKIYFDVEYTGKDRNSTDKIVDLKIYIPRCVHVLNLDLDRGNVKFHDDLRGILNVDINTADIEINKFIGKINIKGDVGNVRILNGKLSENSSIIQNIGSINIKSEFEEGGEYRINTGTGNIELWAPENSKVSFESVGAIEENNFKENNYPTKVRVNSSMGKISIKKY